jgi:dimethylsulfone monooxygenase
MVEGLEIIKGMLTSERFSFAGRYYRVEETLCEPKPVQRPLPPIR